MDIEVTAGQILNGIAQLDSDQIKSLANQAILDATENVADAQGKWVHASAVSRKWLDIYANNPEFVANIDQITQEFIDSAQNAVDNASTALSEKERLKVVLKGLARGASWGGVGITLNDIDTAIDNGNADELGRVVAGVAGSFVAGYTGVTIVAGLTTGTVVAANVLALSVATVVAAGIATLAIDSIITALPPEIKAPIRDVFIGGNFINEIATEYAISPDQWDTFFMNVESTFEDVGSVAGWISSYLSESFDFDSDNILSGNNDSNYLDGTAAADTLIGEGGADYLVGQAGNDTLVGGDQNDLLQGGAGDDILLGESGNDLLSGGEGNDTLSGGQGYDVLAGGLGDDVYVFSGSYGLDVVDDASGNNVINLNGRTGFTVTQTGPGSNTYREVDGSGNTTSGYIFIESGGELIVTDENDPTNSITIKQWDRSNNNFGISLNDADSVSVGTADGRYEVKEGYLDEPGFGDYVTSTSVSGVFTDRGVYFDANIFYNHETPDPNASNGLPPPRAGLLDAFGELNVEDSDFSVSFFEENPSLYAPQFYATDQSDVLLGSGVWDLLRGRDGDDYISAAGFSDVVQGGQGSDTILGGEGNDRIWGNEIWHTGSWRTYTGGSLPESIEDNKDFEISTDQDSLYGGYGDDTIGGSSSIDLIVGGEADLGGTTDDDFIAAGANSDTVIGGLGDDKIWGDARVVEPDNHILFEVDGREHDEIVIVFEGERADVTAYNDVIDGGQGNDQIFGELGDDVLHGGDGDDFLSGDRLVTEDAEALHHSYIDLPVDQHGNDQIHGGDGADTIFGNGGDDTITGGSGNDTLFGDDPLIGSETSGVSFDDIIDGGAGSDTIDGGVGNDEILGGEDDDVLIGNAGSDYLNGGKGNDTSFGGDGNDVLVSGGGTDLLAGGNGNDTIVGGSGDDQLEGGAEDDVYVFSGGNGLDTIFDNEGSNSVQFAAVTSARQVTLQQSATTTALVLDQANGDIVVLNNEHFGHITGISGALGELDTDALLATRATEGNDVIYATGKNDVIDALGGQDTVYGQGGDDTLYGGLGDDILYGGEGNDLLIGTTKNADHDFGGSTLDGGAGNDTLVLAEGVKAVGGSGDDTYVIDNSLALISTPDAYGFGTISGTSPTDNDGVLIRGVTSEQVTLRRGSRLLVDEADLFININLPGDTYFVRVENYFDPAVTAAIDSITVEGGPTFDASAILGEVVATTDQDDYVTGLDSNDTINGLAGNDFLDGMRGNDTLSGGAGNDSLYGGLGDDTFLFSDGDGHDLIRSELSDGDDTLVFTNIDSTDIKYQTTTNYSLVLEDANETQSVTLENFFREDRFQIDNVSFADGVTLTYEQLVARARTGTDDDQYILGSSESETLDGGSGSDTIFGLNGDDYLIGGLGNDTLWGFDGEDTLVGGLGSDVLIGNTGNDTYYFNHLGNQNGSTPDADTINFEFGSDVIQFGENITQDMLSATFVRQLGSNNITWELQISIEGGQKIVVEHFNPIYNPPSEGEYNARFVRFADGSELSFEDFAQTFLGIGDHQNNGLIGTREQDTIHGLGGDDTINGHAGDDAIFGDDGVDWLRGGEGNDHLDGGTGNDQLYGTQGDDFLYGQEGNDWLYGGDGLDGVYGGDGDDTLMGGTGDGDYLVGGAGNDTYIYEAGYDGNDIISNYDTDVESHDVLQFTYDVDPSGVMATRSSDHLLLTLQNTGEVITVSNHFQGGASGDYALDAIQFYDGTVWDIDYVEAQIGGGTENADVLYGTTAADDLMGLAGNDTLYGAAGNDELSGGEGNDELQGQLGDDSISGDGGDDFLYGQEGNDVLNGGDGLDGVYGGDGDDTLSGGAGNGDYLVGGAGNDTYLYAAGDGNDTIDNYDTGAERQDVLRFSAGVDPSDVVASRSSDHLLLTLQSTGEVVTVANYFQGNGAGGYALNAIEFDGGTVWDFESVNGQVQQQGTAGNDTFFGSANDDTLAGLAGNDTFYGGAGKDTLSGGEGNDEVQGQEGNDVIAGDAGNDFLYGQGGDDVLNGGDGLDGVYGGDGNDTLSGGAGDGDYLVGGAGNDTYLYAAGDGNDTIANYDTGAERQDVLRFSAGVDPSDVVASRSSDHLLLTLQSTGEVVTVANYFQGNGAGGYALNAIEFDGGTVWDFESVNGLVQQQGTAGNDTFFGNAFDDTLAGLAGNDTFYGGAGNDTLSGGEGNDEVQGQEGNDVIAGDAGDDFLYGQEGNDVLNGGEGLDGVYGGDGDDTLSGGAGDGDYLVGGAGNDTYAFGAGFGNDVVSNYDTQPSSIDIARFDGVTVEDLWFSRSGDHLQITVAGTNDQATVSNWFTSTDYQLDQIEVGSSVLLNNQVDQLVSAMASYNVPTGVGNVIPQDVRDDLQPVLAATWQAA